MTDITTQADSTPKGTLGTFSGVFTPSILTILGIILFLRLGYVVGSAGLGRALLMIGLANLISVLTSFSLAAIATSMKVRGGGDYYLISRTLGVEFGGAIGIVLYLAQSVSIAFYCIGFGEAVSVLARAAGYAFTPGMIAFAALFFLFILAFIGADLATKFQYIVMVVLVLALVSFFWGGIANWSTSQVLANWNAAVPGPGFWILFALFFPAVTGFTQGVSMSGDLKDAGRSLPKGTFIAVSVSIVVYIGVAVVFASSNSLETLATDYGAMKKTASLGVLIDAGVISATLSSAMASFLGAPRILQSLASDRIFPILNPFAKGYGKNSNPRRGVVLSLGIAVAVIALGQLDLIARVVSMFFLISYGLLNYATYFEAGTSSPSFRPRFKWYHKKVSLAGFLCCLGVMLAIDIKTGIAACAILFAVFQYVKRTRGPARWADSQRAWHLQQIRMHLLSTRQDPEHPREWRPYILALSNHTDGLVRLLAFSDMMEGNSGITTAVRIVRGTGYKAARDRIKKTAELKAALENEKIQAFPLVISAVDVRTGLSLLLQSYGVGPVKANTVLFDYPELFHDPGIRLGIPTLVSHIRLCRQSGCNVVLVNDKRAETKAVNPPVPQAKRIDVWWNGDDTSRLMLLLAYLSTRGNEYASADIRLLAVNYDRENRETLAELEQMLDDVRITAKSKIILGVDEKTIVDCSKDADMVFFPVRMKEELLKVLDQFDPSRILQGLRTTAMGIAAGRIDLESDPEEGRVKELAQLHDELEHAQARVRMAQKAASQTRAAARRKMMEIKTESGTADSELERRIKQLMTARKKASESKNKAIKEAAKLEAISEKARKKGISVEEKE